MIITDPDFLHQLAQFDNDLGYDYTRWINDAQGQRMRISPEILNISNDILTNKDKDYGFGPLWDPGERHPETPGQGGPAPTRSPTPNIQRPPIDPHAYTQQNPLDISKMSADEGRDVLRRLPTGSTTWIRFRDGVYLYKKNW
jgi:hypothetical protein